MDAYEATRVVLSRIQSLDPENAAKIMGLLLIRDHGDKELIRLAFSSEALLHAVVAGARKELGLLPPSTASDDDDGGGGGGNENTNSSEPAAPLNANASASAFLLGRQNSSSQLFGGGDGLASLGKSSPPSWPPPPVFSRAGGRIVSGAPEELLSPSNPKAPHFYGAAAGCGNYPRDEFLLQQQPSFVNNGASVSSQSPKGEPFYPEVNGGVRGSGTFPYSKADCVALRRRRCSAADEYAVSEATEFGWNSYLARGYCRNGPGCRSLHGLPDDVVAEGMSATGKMDSIAAADQLYQELLLRSKSQRQLVASALPYSPTSSLPESPLGPNKYMNFLLQQQNESQRAAATLMLRGNEGYKFISRSGMMEMSDYAAAISNSASRQIYLTFPADSTFKEEDVSNYFSIYGPVEDVRIPYQQKRMFGFVTFVYPETVKLILAKGNPHFVSDARVLVKPYKEKGKVPDKCRRQHQQAEKSDIPGCVTPMGLETRYPFEFPQLGTRMSYNSDISQEALLRRKLEEQQQATELQHAIELRSQQFMGLRLLDLKTRNHFDSNSTNNKITISPTSVTTSPPEYENCIAQKEDKNWNPTAVTKSETVLATTAKPQLKTSQQSTVNSAANVNVVEGESYADKGDLIEDISFGESILEHNLPDSPFASSTKASFFVGGSISSALQNEENMVSAVSTGNKGTNHHIGPGSVTFSSKSTLDIASFNQVFI